jgi:hypothetical protein
VTPVAADDADAHPSDTDGDTIKIEYHPSSDRRSETFAPENHVWTAPLGSTPPVDPSPWLPFRTREDFEFAELALETGMSKAQTNAMIRLFHKCIEDGKGCFTLSSHDEMQETLSVASERLPKVCLRTYVVCLISLILCYLSSKRKLFQ